MFKKLIVIGLISAYLLYTPVPKDWDPSLLKLGVVFKIIKGVVNLVVGVASCFGYSEWDIWKPLSSSQPSPLKQLEPDQSVLVDGVDVKKEIWDDVPVYIFTPHSDGSSESLRSGMVYYHGGGWTLMGVEGFYKLLVTVSREANLIIVSPNYRLAPEHPFPAAYDDSLLVARKVFDQSAALGIDAERIAISGDSAGGNLAAAVCLELVNDKERNHRPKYQFLTYPATDLITFNHNSHHYYKDDPILSRDRMDAFRLSYLGYDGNKRVLSALRKSGHLVVDGKVEKIPYLDQSRIPSQFQREASTFVSLEDSIKASQTLTKEEKTHLRSMMFDKRMSPIVASLEEMRNLPKTTVLTCQADQLSDEGILYLTKLEEAGVNPSHVYLKGLPHGSMSMASAATIKSTWEGHEHEGLHEQYARLLKEGLDSETGF